MARVSVLQDKWSQAQDALTSVDAWMNGGDPNAGVYHVFSSGANDGDNQMYEDPNAPTLKLMVRPSFLADADEAILELQIMSLFVQIPLLTDCKVS